MSKFIKFDEENKVFHLKNEAISYIFSVEDGGVLSHIYFGKTIDKYNGSMKFPRVDRGFSGNLPFSSDRTYSLDTIPREYSSNGEGDFRVSSIIIEQENGSNATSFSYENYKIIEGTKAKNGLPQVYSNFENEAETLIITLIDKIAMVKLKIFYTIFENQAVIVRSSSLENLNLQKILIKKLSSAMIDFPSKKMHVISLPGAHVNERFINREPVSYGIKKFSSKRGTTSHQMSNFISLVEPDTNEHSGQAYGFNLVYSGNHSIEVEKDQFGQTRVALGINDENFSWELSKNEVFESPEVIMVYSDQGINDMSKTFHQLINNNVVRGKYKNQVRPILINNWEATYFDFNEDKLKTIVDQAKKLGIELFVLDDGWYGQRDSDDSSLGDWYVDKKKFPNGLKSFADYVHKQGLEFGIWLEPEMISKVSNLYSEHPDYLMSVPGREPSPSRGQYILDFSRQDVRDNIINQLEKILDLGFIDYIKWDMNRNISDVYSIALPSEQQGEVLHRYMLGLYQMLEHLVNKYPDILWEGCSGGGGRFDTGFAYYMPQSWTSDNTDAIARLKIQYGTSLIYPTSTMTSHVSVVPNHQTGRITPLETRGNVAMSGVLGYELDLTKLEERDKKIVAQQISNYKNLRNLIQFGDFIRIKSPFDGNEVAWMYINKEKTEFVLYSFNILNEAQQHLITTRLKGLNPDYKYQNVQSNEIFGGDELMNIGFYEPVADCDFKSFSYHFKAI